MEIKTKLTAKPFTRKATEPQAKPIHLVFWNGVHFSPMVMTTNERIRERLHACLNDYARGHKPASMSAQFVAISVAEGLPTQIFSIPEKSTGGTVAFMTRREFWPMEKAKLGGGVFLVHNETGEVQFWGGDGLWPDDQYNPGIPGRVMLLDLEFTDGNDSQDHE